MIESLKVLGAMAGSSMDGLDLALLDFTRMQSSWNYKWIKVETIPYSPDLFQKLKDAPLKKPQEQQDLDQEFGVWIANTIQGFLKADAADLAAIHGHTLVHKPNEGISWQLGSGEIISSILRIPTITDFRAKDIELGGQGAPLVPFGDFELFPSFDACLNLGGICNVSFKQKKLAWDIAPCNQVLNHFAQQAGHPFDDKGNLGRQGQLDPDFMKSLKGNAYFRQQPPKSLPNGFLSHLLTKSIVPQDGLFTYAEFLSEQISEELLAFSQIKKMLITGGGAYNDFLVEKIRHRFSNTECIVPNEPIISFKEALIFGFLGLKRYLNEVNVHCSVTGAKEDSCSGVIHLPK